MPAEPSASRWSPILAFAVVSAANQMLWLTYAPITTDAARHYGVSDSAIGWFAELFPLLYVVLALPTGRLIDQRLSLGLGTGACLTALGAVVRLGADRYAVVLVGQVLIAIAQPLVLNAVTKLAARCLRPDRRPAGIAVSSAGVFGGIVLALVTGAAFGVGHLRWLLLVQAAFAVVGAGWLLLCLARLGSGDEDIVEPAALGPRAVLGNPAVRYLIVLAAGGFGVFVAMTTWLQTLLDPAGVSESQAGTLLLLLVLAGVLGAALLPAALARRRRETQFIGMSIVVGAVAVCWLAVWPGFVPAIPAMVILGALLLTDLPLILELVERHAGPAAGMATALLWLAGNLGGLVLALVVQVLVHRPTVAFVVMAAALLAVAPALARLRRQYDLSRPGRPAPTTLSPTRRARS